MFIIKYNIFLAIIIGFGDNLSFFGDMRLNNYLKDPEQPALGCVIWLHGLGADASDMAGLAEQSSMAELPLRHVFMNAPIRPVTINGGMPMPAWYDILGMTLMDREDRTGITQSQTQINAVINEQISAGFEPEKIILAGFSQGGAMALYTSLSWNKPLGGVIALSAYLPLALELQPVLSKQTPVFIGSGSFDPIVQPAWTRQSVQWLQAKGFEQLSIKEYPMEHTICPNEIRDVTNWLNAIYKGVGL